MRPTIKSLQAQIETLRELRKEDQSAINNLNRRCADHETKGMERDRLLKELQSDKMFLKQLCQELSSALRIRS